MKFFADNCLAPKHARALAPLLEPEHTLIHLREKFAEDTPDEVWLPKLAEDGDWIIISGDAGIMRNAVLRAVWQQTKLTAFFLTKGWMHLPLFEQHAKLSHCLPEIIKHAERAKPGTGFSISVNGKVEQIYP